MSLFKKKNKSNDFLDAYNNKYGNAKSESISSSKIDYDKKIETTDSIETAPKTNTPVFKNKKQEIEYLKSRVSQLEAENTSLKAQNDELSALISDEAKELISLEDSLREKVADLTDMIDDLNSVVKDKRAELSSLKTEIEEKNSKILQLDDEILYQDFGLYKPKYNCINSDEYKEKINNVRQKQKNMIRDKLALNYYDNWTLDGSRSKGRAMNNDNMKIALLAFNGECDTLINKVKFNNVNRIEERINKIADKVNKLNQRNKISITGTYRQLKIEELHLCYEYEKKKQEEKEEMRRIREQEREQQKLQKEIEEARKKIKKEQAHYSKALEQLLKQIESASEKDTAALLEKKQEIEQHLNDIDVEIKNIDYREANQKAGYVYIISNIGSFGENIYKIGMTRRLDPQDRVDELGDASVPFRFDVHAMIFSEDAPALEASLHQAFESKKVNMVNNRKEFFNVTLDEIEEVVKKNYDKTVEFTRLPEAEQYRESEIIKKQMAS